MHSRVSRTSAAPRARTATTSRVIRVRAYVGQGLVDVLAILASVAFVALLRGDLFTTQGMLLPAGLMIPLFVGAALMERAYSLPVLTDPWSNVARGVRALIVGLLAVMFVTFTLKATALLPRLTLTFAFLLSCITVAVGRYYFAKHITTIVGGSPFTSVLINDSLDEVTLTGFSEIIGSDRYPGLGLDDPIEFDRLAQDLDGVDRVVVLCDPDRREAWTHALMGTNIHCELVIPELAKLSPLAIGSVAGTPTLVVSNGPLGIFDRFVKRAFDLVVATSALVLFSPVLIATAVAIRMTSDGPILFSQRRIGLNNRMFKMYKFRSMRVEHCDTDGRTSTARDDVRITAVGRFIRKTSIDELAQLLNVFLGDMSIVGPRPHALGSRAAGKLFWEVDGRYWHRHAAKPGLTGLAQIRGFRGATVAEDDLVRRLHADLEYLEHWTIWRDLKILVMTVRVLVHRNAF